VKISNNVTFIVTTLIYTVTFSVYAEVGRSASPSRSAAASRATVSESAPFPVSLALEMGSAQLTKKGSYPNAAVDSNLEYTFYKDYGLGVDFSYLRPFRETDSDIAKGMDDVRVYLSSKSLWSDKVKNMNLAVKLSLIAPTSEGSKISTMQFGAMQALIFKKGFGGRFALTYTWAATEYSYKQRKFEYEGQEIDNTRFRITNKLIASYDFTKNFHGETGGSIRTYNDYANYTFDIYAAMVGLSYDFNKNASIKTWASSAIKDRSGNTPWNGPAVADNWFESDGVIVYIGTTLQI
jgi:hypothetical protein